MLIRSVRAHVCMGVCAHVRVCAAGHAQVRKHMGKFMSACAFTHAHTF